MTMPYMVALLSFLWIGQAHAFKHIEADALYNGMIREQIEREFSQGVKMLEVQARSLNMDVRKRDLRELGEYMHTKATLMGMCADRAIDAQKKTTKKLDYVGMTKRCIDEHLKFWDKLNRGEVKSIEPNICGLMKAHDPNYMTPYPFLGLSSVAFAYDVINMKKCFANPRAWLR